MKIVSSKGNQSPNPSFKRDAAEARRPLTLYMDAHFFAKPSIHNFENR